MTLSEAMEKIFADADSFCDDCDYCDPANEDCGACAHTQARNVLAEEAQKRIPMMPKMIDEDEFFAACPVCGSPTLIPYTTFFCQEKGCGQAIKWSEEE